MKKNDQVFSEILIFKIEAKMLVRADEYNQLMYKMHSK